MIQRDVNGLSRDHWHLEGPHNMLAIAAICVIWAVVYIYHGYYRTRRLTASI